MRAVRVSLAVVLLLVMEPLARNASHFWAMDGCLDSGGAWYGALGCEIADPPKIDRLIVDKSDRELRAYSGRRLIHAMPVSLGREPVGQKQVEGDNRTPEGTYPVVVHKEDSAYFRSLRLGYPTPAQLTAGRRAGRDSGGDIMIHGLPNGLAWIGPWHRLVDWTRGCIALTNGEMLWLYRNVSDGTPVEIRA